MKKTFFYFSIVALYLFTTICIMMTLGTMVSSKYEVDEGYWLIDGNNSPLVRLRGVLKNWSIANLLIVSGKLQDT